MELNESTLRRIASLLVVLVMAVLAFFVIQPILFALIGGLLLAYIFHPIFLKVNLKIKNRSLSAFLVIIIIAIILLVPIVIIAPTFRDEIAHLFIFFQTFDLAPIVQKLLPSSSEQIVLQLSNRLKGLITTEIGNIFDSIPKYILTFFLDVAVVLLVFFFGLRDSEKLKSFINSVSGFSKSREKIIINNFKDITDSIVYGHVIVGMCQGLLVGLALLVFGIPDAFVLTIVAIFLAIIPFIGTPLIWVPVTIYLFLQGNPTLATIYLLFNLIVVSAVDNLMRAYIVAKRSKISEAVVLIGMIGGGIIFGIVGLVLGPLILAYFITFLSLHRDKNSKGNIFFE